RHEVLRSVIVVRDGDPVAVPGPHRRLPFAVVDLSGLAAPAERAAELLHAQTRRPFDLAAGPLGRVTLLRTGRDPHVLAAALHHAATDGWSSTLLAREVSLLYEAYLAGRRGPLAGLPAVQYGDYVRWQRELPADAAGELERLRGLTGGGLPLD